VESCYEIGALSFHAGGNAAGVSRHNRGPVPAGVYHVWRRTAGPVLMFRDDIDRTYFCNRLRVVIERFGWTVVAFVLMPTHFHLILEVDDDVLQPGMHALFGPYAQTFNRRHGRSGHLRAAPYKLRSILDEPDLMSTGRYVARNPVEDKLCMSASEWYWSSYLGSAGLDTPFAFVDDTILLASYHADRRRAMRELRMFVDAV